MHPERLQRRLANAIKPRRQPGGRQLRLRWGVVDAVRGDNTLDIKFGGSATVITLIPRLYQTAGLSPVAGDTVVCITDGVDLICLGKVYT